MADEKRPSGPPGGKRRRPPTTIDLKATEIASDPVKTTEPADTSPETPQTEAPAAAAQVAEELKVETPQESAPPPPHPKPEPRGWRPEWLDLAAMNERISALRAQIAGRTNWRLVGAGATGAAAMLLLFLALWIFGAVSNRDDLTETLAARLAILEMSVRDLAAKPVPAGLDQQLTTQDLADLVTFLKACR